MASDVLERWGPMIRRIGNTPITESLPSEEQCIVDLAGEVEQLQERNARLDKEWAAVREEQLAGCEAECAELRAVLRQVAFADYANAARQACSAFLDFAFADIYAALGEDDDDE